MNASAIYIYIAYSSISITKHFTMCDSCYPLTIDDISVIDLKNETKIEEL